MIDVRLPTPHTAQRQVEASARRFNVLCCGRRWGKDVLLERRAVKKLLKQPHPVGWFAPTYRMMQENYRALKNILAPVITRASETEHRVEVLTGNVIDFWSLDNPDSARGRKYGYVAINEAAMVKALMDAWNMVIRPTLADYKGCADFGSTPKGLNGFYELWAIAEDHPDWTRFKFPTDANPHIPPEEIRAMRESLPARVVQQEIDAEFVADGSYFQRVSERATLTDCDTPDQHTGHSIYGGLDFAMAEDYTVLTLGCRQCNRVVFWDRFNQIDYTYQRARIIDNCQRWAIAGLLPERNSIGQPNIELLAAAGIPVLWGHDLKPGFSTTATTKPELIQALAGALEHDGFDVPADYADELRSYEINVTASGHNQFSAPEGQHDDRVMSLALCWWAMTRTGRAGL
jgi:hypothetical protein